mmetsp:Transcript_113058/g.314380  ORF Transcript_113058/g.314380 Transcript_113058/m.314380 type:complete len:420 (+) Transcript_113058:83-1342(+)
MHACCPWRPGARARPRPRSQARREGGQARALALRAPCHRRGAGRHLAQAQRQAQGVAGGGRGEAPAHAAARLEGEDEAQALAGVAAGEPEELLLAHLQSGDRPLPAHQPRAAAVDHGEDAGLPYARPLLQVDRQAPRVSQDAVVAQLDAARPRLFRVAARLHRDADVPGDAAAVALPEERRGSGDLEAGELHNHDGGTDLQPRGAAHRAGRAVLRAPRRRVLVAERAGRRGGRPLRPHGGDPLSAVHGIAQGPPQERYHVHDQEDDEHAHGVAPLVERLLTGIEDVGLDVGGHEPENARVLRRAALRHRERRRAALLHELRRFCLALRHLQPGVLPPLQLLAQHTVLRHKRGLRSPSGIQFGCQGAGLRRGPRCAAEVRRCGCWSEPRRRGNLEGIRTKPAVRRRRRELGTGEAQRRRA